MYFLTKLRWLIFCMILAEFYYLPINIYKTVTKSKRTNLQNYAFNNPIGRFVDNADSRHNCPHCLRSHLGDRIPPS